MLLQGLRSVIAVAEIEILTQIHELKKAHVPALSDINSRTVEVLEGKRGSEVAR
jgi:hypothetical protein